MSEQYLWDRSGEADAEVRRLEEMLAAFRMPERPLDLGSVAETYRERWWQWPRWSLAAAACAAVVALAVGIALLRPRSEAGWAVTALEGTPQIAGKPTLKGELRVGQRLQTTGDARARLRVDGIGELEVGGNSELELAERSQHRQRVVLRYGAIHARVTAPPAVFVVDTPAARAVDLGCEYSLSVDKEGNGNLVVEAGWVMLDYEYSQSLVPQGAEAQIRAGGRLTPAYFSDASPTFKALLVQLAIGDDQPQAARLKALGTLLAEARVRDAYTLINLFRRSTREERLLVYDRLTQLVPAPAGVAHDAVADGDLRVLSPWWEAVYDALGLRRINKKGGLNLNMYGGLETR
jgi:hypothetical protein